MDGAKESAVLTMSAADWEAIGEDAKHFVEDGRHYVLASCPSGPARDRGPLPRTASRGTPAREAGRAKPADRNRPAQL
ncbi:MAG: hypothetical protein MZV65_42620 [Chromatiales bacterium]|nr:hypothetical protein [Chromatiales bacterium]